MDALSVPAWVPDAARLYLMHTERGSSIRELARQSGTHASTVLRRIRTFEERRDDTLVDEALRNLATSRAAKLNIPAGSPSKENTMTTTVPETDIAHVTEARLKADGQRILRRLCETGAVLAVAAQMDKAVVVRDGAAAEPTRTAVVDRAVAEAMALKGWITCDAPGRISRYRITKAGRSALSRMLAEAENRASGFAEAQTGFDGPETWQDADDASPETGRQMRYGMADSPLIALARRKGRDGTRFITDDLVRAGERLREDFELSHMGPRVTQDWDRFLTTSDRSAPKSRAPARGAEAARQRVEGALADLGPGLGDIALRCCCHLEGLERAEQRMGWSARSGKIVLRIALQRLKRHYMELGEAGGMMG
ncbi:DUF6456 domain-containing protein [Roseovarius carneus]|uniref:DUF6456 domain-containing protein n=1 Tax=Roseovarius carneus TaxID=2853164 RepID=UPI001CCD3DED|nr:DUF6456 domain-containing protein [Roseovarius carneus]